MPKSMTFAILEGIQSEMQRDKLLTLFYEYQTPSAGFSGRTINLEAQFGRLLTSDEGSYSFCNCAEIVARVAEALPGTKIKRLAFPDAPAPGAPEMLSHMRVDATRIAAAARKLVRT